MRISGVECVKFLALWQNGLLIQQLALFNVCLWPLAAMTLDRVGTAAIGGAADQNVALDSG
jgi:hypothetical protein